MAAPADIIRRWVNAYVDGRREDLVALAHPEIVVHPRRGQGEPEYRGIDGVRRWLLCVGHPAPPFELAEIEALDDGRLIAVGAIHDVGVVAVFEIRDAKVFAVASYTSDRQLLHNVGII